MQHDKMHVEIELLSYWRTASGAGQAATYDTLCARDAEGLPYVPGRQIKGLLRDAVRRLECWDAKTVPLLSADASFETLLFGEQGLGELNADTEERIAFRRALPGALTFTDARLSLAERSAFAEDVGARNALFTALNSTAIDANGVAKRGSLRTEEVAIPMTLQCEIGFEPTTDNHQICEAHWREVLDSALPLIRAVGAKRHRGLGRANLRIKEVANAA